MSEPAGDYTVNLCVSDVSETNRFVFTNWVPGTLRCDEEGLAFTERGKSEPTALLDLTAMASVEIQKRPIVPDDVVVVTKDGAAWSIKVWKGQGLFDALLALGVRAKE